MSSSNEPKPPSQRDAKFPKVMTFPEGWITENIPTNHPNGKNASTSIQPDGNTRPVSVVSDDELLNRRLDPFPRPNTIPNGWDLSTH